MNADYPTRCNIDSFGYGPDASVGTASNVGGLVTDCSDNSANVRIINVWYVAPVVTAD